MPPAISGLVHEGPVLGAGTPRSFSRDQRLEGRAAVFRDRSDLARVRERSPRRRSTVRAVSRCSRGSRTDVLASRIPTAAETLSPASWRSPAPPWSAPTLKTRWVS